MRAPANCLFTSKASASASADCSGVTTTTNKKLLRSAAQKLLSASKRA